MQFEDVRFLSAVSVILTYAIVLAVIEMLVARGAPFGILGAVVTFMLSIWFKAYSNCLTRSRRALFNERNILQTYQIRALTHGHLFVPEPPTPCPMGNGAPSPTNSEFNRARDEHYKDEFKKANEMASEKKFYPTSKVETMRIEFDENSSSPPDSPSKSDFSPNTQI